MSSVHEELTTAERDKESFESALKVVLCRPAMRWMKMTCFDVFIFVAIFKGGYSAEMGGTFSEGIK